MLTNLRSAATRVGSERADLLRRIRNVNPALANELDQVKLGWWRIKNQAENDTTEILIYEVIGGYFGETTEGFIQRLNEITTANIDVRINSPGGSVWDAIAIYNALVKHSANVNVYVDSLAASAASVIAMAGDKITMMVGSQMMIHDAMGFELGNAADMRAFAEYLDRQSDNISTIYAARAGGESTDWRTKMIAETWMFANEAVEMGLADEVYQKPVEQDETDPEVEEDEEPEDPDDGENGDDDSEEEIELEGLMTKRHPLAQRGYKYSGRRRAPSPVSNNSSYEHGFEIPNGLDRFMAAMQQALGGTDE